MQLIGGERQKKPSLNNKITNFIAEKRSLTKIAFESHDVEILKCISIPTNLIYSQKFSEIFEHVQGFYMLKVCWSQSLFYHIDFDSSLDCAFQ